MTETKYPEAFSQFVEYCVGWVNKLQLGEWEVRFMLTPHRQMADENSLSECSTTQSRLAIISFPDPPLKAMTDQELQRLAFHEAGELLLAPLVRLIESDRRISNDEITETVHAVLNRLEHLLLDAGKVPALVERELPAAP